MNLPRITQSVYFEPWSITREGWQAVHAIVKPRILGGDLVSEFRTPKLKQPVPELGEEAFGEITAASDDTDIFGNPMPKMEIGMDGVAVIPIIGTLIHHATLLDKMCGACSYDDVKRDVAEALNTSGLSKIVFHVDSPGGMCMGCNETAAVIDQAAELVRCEAVTDGLMCSAGYDLIAGCHKICCTPSAVVGSIGAMAAWLDQSVRYEMAGLKVELFQSGDLKGTGTPGTALTDKQRDYLQSRVDKYAEMFKAHVREHRMIEDSDMHGGTFIGSDAVDVGLVDEIVQDVEECFELH